MSSKTITISLDRGDALAPLKDGERLQVDAYEKAHEFLKETLQKAREHKADAAREGVESLSRIHEAIFVGGARGTGKSAFIISLEEYIKGADKDISGSIHFCKPIDPTLLNDDESFLNIIVAKLHDEVQQARRPARQSSLPARRHCDDQNAAYHEALEKVASAMEGLESKDPTPGMERILFNKNGLGLYDHLQRFYAEVCRKLDCDLVVLPIDDADMAPQWTFDILDVIRRYLACPLILPIVTGDMKQFRHVVATKFHDDLNKVAEIRFSKIDDLADQFLAKILPVERHIEMQSILDIAQVHEIFIESRIHSSSKRVHFLAFCWLLDHIIHHRHNGTDIKVTYSYPRSIREVKQWLTVISESFFSMPIDGVYTNRDQVNGASERAREISRSIRDARSDKSAEMLFKIFDGLITYSHWQHDLVNQTRFKAEMEIISPRGLFSARPLADLSWFNAMQCPDKLGLFEWNASVQETFRKSENPFPIDIFFPKTFAPFPPLEPYSKYAIITRSQMGKIETSEAKILASLFTYDNYYTDYQATNLVFFGKAFELVANSLLGEKYDHNIYDIFLGQPYHSYFSAFPSRMQMGVGEFESGDDNIKRTIIKHEDIELVTEYIVAWRKKYLDCSPSSILIQSAMNKAFGLFVHMKLHKTLFGDSLFDVIERFRRVILNSFAAYEKDTLSGDRRVVLHNVALGKQESIKSVESWENNDQAFRINIRPLLSPGSITYSIANHPIFAMVGTANDARYSKAIETKLELHEIRVTSTVRSLPTVSDEKSAKDFARDVYYMFKDKLISVGGKKSETNRDLLFDIIR